MVTCRRFPRLDHKKTYSFPIKQLGCGLVVQENDTPHESCKPQGREFVGLVLSYNNSMRDGKDANLDTKKQTVIIDHN